MGPNAGVERRDAASQYVKNESMVFGLDLKKIVIIGAGLTGLSAAYHLDHERTNRCFSFNILEACDRPGGLCRTEEEKGFLFDYTGHLIHFKTLYFENLVRKLLSPNLARHNRRAWIYSHGVYTPYPFQANLYGLPQGVVLECLFEFCKVYFSERKKSIKTFNDWILANFGKGIARHFMIPYNLKLWRHHPSEMTCDWLERFVPKPDLKRVIQGAIGNTGGALGYNAYFYYPKEGGIESLSRALTNGKSHIHVGQEVSRISLNPRMVYTKQGSVHPFDILVSTMPVKELIQIIDPKPRSVNEAANNLNYVSLLNINFGIKGKMAKKHWVYIPEKHLIFYRIGFPSNFSRKTVPTGYSSIYTELSYDHKKGIDHGWAKEKVIADLVTMGLIKGRSEIVAEKVLDIPFAYVIYDSHRKQSLSEIEDFLAREGIFSAGRYGAWKYSTMEDAVLDGKKIAAAIGKICKTGLISEPKETKIGGIV